MPGSVVVTPGIRLLVHEKSRSLKRAEIDFARFEKAQVLTLLKVRGMHFSNVFMQQRVCTVGQT